MVQQAREKNIGSNFSFERKSIDSSGLWVCLDLYLTNAVDKSEVLSDCDLDFLGTNRCRRWGVVGAHARACRHLAQNLHVSLTTRVDFDAHQSIHGVAHRSRLPILFRRTVTIQNNGRTGRFLTRRIIHRLIDTDC